MSSLVGRKILVTGGSGFIGTHLITALQQAGAGISNLDLNPPKIDQQRPYWVECNMLAADCVASQIEKYEPDVIIHLAAQASLSANASALIVNTEGCKVLLAAAEKLRSPPYIIHTSTQLVVKAGYTATGPRDFSPYSAYGESKAQSERIFHQASNQRWTIVRPTFVWGAYHPSFADAAWAYISKRYYMHPTGHDPVRSYGYVENVVHQYLSAIRASPVRVDGKTFYVGDDPLPSSKWLDAFSIALTGRPVRRVPRLLLRSAAVIGEISQRLGGPSPINLGRLHRMTTDYVVPMEPTFDSLGRGPVELDAGVDRTVSWLKTHWSNRSKG